MNNKPPTLILVLFVSISALGAGTGGQGLLRDGFALTGIEGKFSTLKGGGESEYIKFEQDEVWLFKLASDVNDYRGLVTGGTKLQLLPSRALEKMLADVAEHPDGTYRLWGRITKYKGANYIFAEYFLPVVEMLPVEPEEPIEPNEPEEPEVRKESAEPNEPEEAEVEKEPEEPNEPPEQQTKPTKPTSADEEALRRALADPNGVLEIPKEILDKLNSRKVILPRKITPRLKPQEKNQKDAPPAKKPEKEREKDGEKDSSEPDKVDIKPEGEDKKNSAAAKDLVEKAAPARRPAMKLDSMLADRTAVLLKQDNGRLAFVLDALGLSVQEVSLRLLPCEVLELTEARQIAELNRPLFKIAGIKTEYKSKEYLLLQKATRAYGHGNFGR
jgi:hypothetical protein